MTGPPKPKTPFSSQLGGTKDKRGSTESLVGRAARYHTAKSHTVRLLADIGPTRSKDIGIRFQRVTQCGDWLKFRDYYQSVGIKLHSANFCKNTLVCSLCAIRRASRNMAAYLEKLQEIQKQNKTLKPYLVTLTVRNNSDLEKVLNHLADSLKLLHHRRVEKKSRSLMRDIAGGVFSIEVTNTGKEWHPHVHAIWLSETPPDMYALRAEWEQITGDSFMCDVRPITKLSECPADIDPHAAGFAEVFKYAMKPSELGADRMVQAFPILKGRRLIGSFGIFRGVVMPESLADDLTGLDDEPYLEFLLRYTAKGYVYHE
jgi:hypothetical protein